jgi:hypothetical protein
LSWSSSHDAGRRIDDDNVTKVSAKATQGLLTYDFDPGPVPQRATVGSFSEDDSAGIQ